MNSALQRARATVADAGAAVATPRSLSDEERQVVDAFLRAWAAGVRRSAAGRCGRIAA